MTVFEIGSVVRVPFPYVESEVREHRPALVVSHAVGPHADLFWALMITSAANRGWPGDIDVGAEHRDFGLPIPSVVRCAKIAVIETRFATELGQFSPALMISVRAELDRILDY